jgi:hypothetical protein
VKGRADCNSDGGNGPSRICLCPTAFPNCAICQISCPRCGAFSKPNELTKTSRHTARAAAPSEISRRGVAPDRPNKTIPVNAPVRGAIVKPSVLDSRNMCQCLIVCWRSSGAVSCILRWIIEVFPTEVGPKRQSFACGAES